MSRFFAALYVSEVWHNNWRSTGSVYAKARAMVLFDRVLIGEYHRLQPHGGAIADIQEEAKP